MIDYTKLFNTLLEEAGETVCSDGVRRGEIIFFYEFWKKTQLISAVPQHIRERIDYISQHLYECEACKKEYDDNALADSDARKIFPDTPPTYRM